MTRTREQHAIHIILMLGAMLLLGSTVAWAENTDPNNDGSQYAWGENVGWLNAELNGEGGPGLDVTDTDLSGYLWGENIGCVSLSCVNTGSCGTTDYGVTNDGSGNLAGYAWAENAGWISFSCTNPANTGSCTPSNYGVTINPNTGVFDGKAWAENVGWIAFAPMSGSVAFGVTTAWNAVAALACDFDADNDCDQNDLNPLLAQRNQPASVDPRLDLDGDGLITALDARILVTQCTLPRCAVAP